MNVFTILYAIVWTAVAVTYVVNSDSILEPPKKEAHTTNVIIIVPEK